MALDSQALEDTSAGRAGDLLKGLSRGSGISVWLRRTTVRWERGRPARSTSEARKCFSHQALSSPKTFSRFAYCRRDARGPSLQAEF